MKRYKWTRIVLRSFGRICLILGLVSIFLNITGITPLTSVTLITMYIFIGVAIWLVEFRLAEIEKKIDKLNEQQK
jgi:amino acid transporter